MMNYHDVDTQYTPVKRGHKLHRMPPILLVRGRDVEVEEDEGEEGRG